MAVYGFQAHSIFWKEYIWIRISPVNLVSFNRFNDLVIRYNDLVIRYNDLVIRYNDLVIPCNDLGNLL